MTTHPTLFIRRTGTLNVLNGIGRLLQILGIDPFSLDEETIIDRARNRSGFAASLPSVEEGLRRLVASVRSESDVNPFGQLAMRRLLERTLYGRYQMEQHLRQFPEIEDTPICRPVFIIGMPRTGTTILHAMLHEDPANRSPLAFECLLPWPPSTPATFRDNPRLTTIRREFGQLFRLVPDFLKKHHMAADAPQECLSIDALDFNSFQTSVQVYAPSYMHWVTHEADRLSTMRFHRRFLQYLQSGGVFGERWLLKSPVHLMRLGELFAVYPDAQIIMTHRDPVSVVTSTASLMTSVRSLYSDSEDPVRTGQEQLQIWSLYFQRFMACRRELQREDQFIDLRFDDFAADPLAVARQIYDRFQWSWSDDLADRFCAFQRQYPRGKHGTHRYAPETFGLSAEQIREAFSDYIAFVDQL